MLALGFSVFLILQRPDDTDVTPGKKYEEQEKPSGDKEGNKNKQSDYEKGLEFYRQKDYDAAERYFNKVTEDDDNYDNAQKRLEKIKKLRDENNTSSENERNRHVRPKPVERIR